MPVGGCSVSRLNWGRGARCSTKSWPPKAAVGADERAHSGDTGRGYVRATYMKPRSRLPELAAGPYSQLGASLGPSFTRPRSLATVEQRRDHHRLASEWSGDSRY